VGHLKLKKIKEGFIRVISIIIGSFISSIALNAFIIPHKLLSGGVSGISLIIQYLSGTPSGYLILAFNLPIFIIGLRVIDKDFILFSAIGMLSFSGFLILTKDISQFLKVKDILLSCIYGGVISGIGAGIVFRARASQGGIDIIAVIMRRKIGTSIASLAFGMNLFVVTIGAFIGSIEKAMYTLIAMYITSVVIDKVIGGFDIKKMLLIITEKEDEVSNAIMKDLGRGVTFFYGEGAYTGDKKRVIYCMITIKQLSRIKKIIEDIDPTSFISVIDASEVKGQGFKKPAL
jgi:uncharacterized membrane-anchored protein YitT (DUF2179 family)